MEQSRQGHDNKLADGFGENKGHQRLDIIAIPISQDLSAAQQVQPALRGCRDPHPLTPLISRSHSVSLVTQTVAECKDEEILWKKNCQKNEMTLGCLSPEQLPRRKISPD